MEGVPAPTGHFGHGEEYLFRACQLLDQVSRQLDELLAAGRAPVIGVTTGADVMLCTQPQVELVSEPAVPESTAGATDATPGRKPVRKTRTTRTSGKDT